MSEPETATSQKGGPAHAGPPSGSPGPLGDLGAMIEELQKIGVRFAGDAFALIQSQARLSAYVLRGSIAIWATRVLACGVVMLLTVAAWVFVNMAVWHLAAGIIHGAFVPPLSLVLLNGGAALLVHAWQKRLVLR